MLTRRLILAVFALATVLPLSGCGCRKNSCSNSNSLAPPPGCCDKGGPPAGFLPPPGP
ncbi:hypothetical protein [Gemmata sp.]|uniref:hypothetical protein n=1 Tax=Gemmata sp. TaxID=1914242 RepID=UPI003F7087A1